jgi:imidazoleglycerol-phosphate dehydratase
MSSILSAPEKVVMSTRTGSRSATVERTTKETDIRVDLLIDGTGTVTSDTGFGFADHMIHLLGFWAGWDLRLTCRGDLQVDAHHTIEDVGLCLGQALDEGLGDRAGIARVGWAKVPMDESLTEVVVDLSGRPYFVYREDLLPPVIAGQEKDLWREFFKSLAFRSRMNLHILFHYGLNGHHLLESACKGLGIALGAACAQKRSGIPSTKGSVGP